MRDLNDPFVGRTIAQYEILARVGGGAMGVVYQARDAKLGRLVALKFLPQQWSHDESAKQRFVREAQAASATQHPNICTIHDIETADDGQLFIVMAFYEGATLKQRLESGPMAVDEALEIATQIADGLAKAHAQGVVHRDIKPGNVMLTEDGVRILDFGLATFVDALKLTAENASFGTPAYMSPEQVRGQAADARSDVWAVGVVLYEMLAGHVPFQGSHAEAIAHAIRHEAPEPLRSLRPEIPEEVEQLVFRALHKDPSVRFQNGRTLARALRQVRGLSVPLDLRTQPMEAPAPPNLPRRLRRRWAITAAAVAVTAIVSILARPELPFRASPAEAPRLPSQKNVAVFPFEVVGGTRDDAAWATGFSAGLSIALTRVTGQALQVVALDQVRPGQFDVAAARADQGATLILVGTVERLQTARRVTGRLLDAASSRELRLSSFTESSSDSAVLQRRLLDSVLRMLELDVTPQVREALAARDTAVIAAHDFYLKGRGYLQYYEQWENIEAAVAAFGDALKLDSRYARAHAGLGEAYWRRTRAGRGQSASEARYDSSQELKWFELATASCATALVLDPRVAAAHVCLGRIHDGRGRYEDAAVDFERALEIEPTGDDAFAGLGHAQEELGRAEQAEGTYRRSIDLRPHYWVNQNRLGHFYYNQGRYADAAELFAQVIALAPDSFRGYSNLGGAYIQLGRYDEAITALERSVTIRPTASSTSNLGVAYFNRGRFADAVGAFERAVSLVATNYELWGNLADAYWHWAPDKRSAARDAYRRAIELGSPQLKVNPRDSALLVKLAYYHAVLGERRASFDLADRALKIAPKDDFVLFKTAVTMNRLGETRRSLDLLEQAIAAGYSLTIVRDTPDLNNLWNVPRFQNLLRGR